MHGRCQGTGGCFDQISVPLRSYLSVGDDVGYLVRKKESNT